MTKTTMTTPQWQDLFRGTANSSASGSISWRIIRKRGNPMMALPSPCAAAVRSLDLYAPQSSKARFATRLLRWALRLRLPLRLDRAELPVVSTPFTRFLQEKAGTQTFPPVAVFCGNPHTAGRRFIVLVFDERNQPCKIVKAGIGPEAIRLINQERQFLSTAIPLRLEIPKLLGTIEDQNLNAIALDFFPGESPTAKDANLAADILPGWIRENESVAIGETAPWRELESAFAGSGGRTDENHRRAWKRVEPLRNHKVAGVIWHGDFARWNMKLDRASGRCIVFDWERGQLRGVPGWDWFHFVLQPAVLVERLAAGQLREHLDALLQSDAFAAYAKRSGIPGRERELALACLLYNLEVLKPSEGGEALRALLDLLMNSWTSDIKS